MNGASIYPWYEIVRDQSLEQGDILRDFEILDMNKAFSPDVDDYDVVLQTMDVIVLTQSCDIEQNKARSYHLISDSTFNDVVLPVSVVDFHEIYSAPTAQVREFVSHGTPRLRLCPPYKEHLAQAFARFFMRVGLPINIPKDKLKL